MTQRQVNDSRLPAGTRIGAARLAVIDLDRMERFYREVLGLERLDRTDDAVTLGTLRAPLLRLEAGATHPPSRGEPGLYHLAFLLPERADLAAWLLHVSELAVPLQGAADHAVSEAIYLADPEGNGVEVVRDRPREAWPQRDGRTAMTTDPLDVGALTAAVTGPWTAAPEATTLGHVHLQVADVGRSTRFYADALGLPRTAIDIPMASFLGAGGYHHHLGLNSWQVRTAARGDAGTSGLRSFELLLPGAEALARTVERLTAHGVTVRSVGPAVEVVDPDGTAVHLVASRATPS